MVRLLKVEGQLWWGYFLLKQWNRRGEEGRRGAPQTNSTPVAGCSCGGVQWSFRAGGRRDAGAGYAAVMME